MARCRRPKHDLASPLNTLYSLGTVGGLTDGELLDVFLRRDDRRGAEAAFGVLLERHGRMVLSVCRHELDDPNDADDAFQATFLVLVRNARSVRRRESVGGWLLGIARRVAARSRVDAARRGRQRDELASQLSQSGRDRCGAAGSALADFGPLAEEIERLPERFRAPILLHYFEGLSAEAAAGRLKVARGTVLSRLARARARLRARLERRGFSLESLLPSGVLAYPIKSGVVVPAMLFEATMESASCLALAGASLECAAPAVAAGLARQVGHALLMMKVRVAAGFLGVAVVGLSLGWAVAGPGEGDRGGEPEKAAVLKGAAQAAVEVKGVARNEGRPPVMARGRVLGPDGKPMGGVEIYLHAMPQRILRRNASARRVGITKADGLFEVAIARALFDPIILPMYRSNRPVDLSFLAPGYGPRWVSLDVTKASKAITLLMFRDDYAIEGRVVNRSEQPIVGANVRAVRLDDPPQDELTTQLGQRTLELGINGPLKAVRTDQNGQFRFSGSGFDHGVQFMIDGPEIETMLITFLPVAVHAPPLVNRTRVRRHREIVGTKFQVTAKPGRTIEGVVRDADTKEPVKRAEVQTFRSWGHATADEHGRFQLTGCPVDEQDMELIVSVPGEPYVCMSTTIGPEVARRPVSLSIRRGIWVEGRVVDKADGRPVQATVRYLPRRDNSHLKEYPDIRFARGMLVQDGSVDTDNQGHFRIVVLPGAGLLTVQTIEDSYLAAPPLPGENAGNLGHMNLGYLYTDHSGSGSGRLMLWMWHCQALVPIDVREGVKVVVPDVVMTRGPERPRGEGRPG